MRIRIEVDEGPERDNPLRVEVSGGWIAGAQHTGGDPPAAEVTLRYRGEPAQSWPAYWLMGRWRCHGVGRAEIPKSAKNLARRVLAQLPQFPNVPT